MKLTGEVIFRKMNKSGSWRVGLKTEKGNFFHNVNEEPPQKGEDYQLDIPDEAFKKQKPDSKQEIPRYVALKTAASLFTLPNDASYDQIIDLRDKILDTAGVFEQWLKS